MIREHLMGLHWSALPVVSMVLFMAVFFGAVIWVYRRGSDGVYRDLSALPLDQDGGKS